MGPSPSYVPVIANGRPLTPTTVAATGTITSAGKLLGADMMPADHGFESWTHDPYYASSSSLVVNQRVYVVKLPVRRAFTAAALWWSLSAAGVGPVAGQNQVGWYTSAGVLLNSVVVDGAITGSGGQRSVVPASLALASVYAGFMFNAATPPTLIRGSSAESTPSVNLATTALRAAVVASGAVTLPPTFDPATLTTSNCLTLWAALEGTPA